MNARIALLCPLFGPLALHGIQPELAENPLERATLAWKYLD